LTERDGRWAATIDSHVTLVDSEGEWDERLHRRINVEGDDLAAAMAQAVARYLVEMVPTGAEIAHVREFKCTLM
jgi:hypothetical protein